MFTTKAGNVSLNPFQHSAPVYNIVISERPTQIEEKRAYWAHRTKIILSDSFQVPFNPLSIQ